MNTVQNAAVLADYFCNHFWADCVEHLSTALTPLDRGKTLERVRKRLRSIGDANWTLIATSCVEAGVDLSFRTGFRELGSLVSLLQAAGRVNRECLYAEAEIWTFCTVQNEMFSINLGLKDAAAVLRGYFDKCVEISPDLSTKSISDEIRLFGLSTKHKKLINYENTRCFPEVENGFKVIDTNTRIAIVDENLISKIHSGKIDWRELQENSVQIPKYKLDEMRAQEVLHDIYRWNLKYDDFLGYMAGIVQLKKLETSGGI